MQKPYYSLPLPAGEAMQLLTRVAAGAALWPRRAAASLPR